MPFGVNRSGRECFLRAHPSYLSSEVVVPVGALTSKLTEFDLGYRLNPSEIAIESPFSIQIRTVSGAVSSSAGTTAVTSLLLTKLVSRMVSPPFADHIATVLTGPSMKRAPVMCSVSSDVPAIALVGAIEVIEGCGGTGGADVVDGGGVGRTGFALLPQAASNPKDTRTVMTFIATSRSIGRVKNVRRQILSDGGGGSVAARPSSPAERRGHHGSGRK
jgi:hypothetical protein